MSGSKRIANPLLDAWKECVGNVLVKNVLFHHPSAYVKSVMTRDEKVREYAWAIPTIKALKAICTHSPIVEIGAGTGYWAALLKSRGADIVAYDSEPPDQSKKNHWHSERKTFHPVLKGGPEKVAEYSNRSLFLCWPPYDDPMAADCLKLYRGHTLIFIGENAGGCTGDTEFWDLVNADWEEAECIEIPQWAGLHDMLVIYRRKVP